MHQVRKDSSVGSLDVDQRGCVDVRWEIQLMKQVTDRMSWAWQQRSSG